MSRPQGPRLLPILSVKFRDLAGHESVIEACGGIVGRNLPPLRLVDVTAPEDADLETIRQRLEAHPAVERATYRTVARIPPSMPRGGRP